ncbi:chaperonin 10-like protein [Leptodontidium sp. 2 PMI_412]|nr:chaperonin 10-like protein [Leptodontidium sp. 2 PMI_412]
MGAGDDEAYINKDLDVEIRDVPVLTAGPGELLIRVKVPKIMGGEPRNHRDDIAGYVEAVGVGVIGFGPGDRVVVFHQMFTPYGSYAEYSVAAAKAAFCLPNTTSFEEAATIPLAGMTDPITVPTPFVVNGAATTVGSFAIKLAALSNICPIITIAGKGISFVETLFNKSKGDIIIDYRLGNDHINEQLRKVAGERGITVPGSNAGLINRPAQDRAKLRHTEFGSCIYNLISLGLAAGWFSGHPYEVAKGGLAGLEGALKDLEAGKISTTKYVLRLAETPGASN